MGRVGRGFLLSDRWTLFLTGRKMGGILLSLGSRAEPRAELSVAIDKICQNRFRVWIIWLGDWVLTTYHTYKPLGPHSLHPPSTFYTSLWGSQPSLWPDIFFSTPNVGSIFENLSQKLTTSLVYLVPFKPFTAEPIATFPPILFLPGQPHPPLRPPPSNYLPPILRLHPGQPAVPSLLDFAGRVVCVSWGGEGC